MSQPLWFEDGLGYTAHFLCRFPAESARVYREVARRLYLLTLEGPAPRREGSALELRLGALAGDLAHLRGLLRALAGTSSDGGWSLAARAASEAIGRLLGRMEEVLPAQVRQLVRDGDRARGYVYQETFLVQFSPRDAAGLRREGALRLAELADRPQPALAVRAEALVRDLVQVWGTLQATEWERYDASWSSREHRLLGRVPDWSRALRNLLEALIAGLPVASEDRSAAP